MSFCGWCIFRKDKKLNKKNSMENSEENQQEENLRNLNIVGNEKDAEECKLMCVSLYTIQKNVFYFIYRTFYLSYIDQYPFSQKTICVFFF